MHNSWQPFNKFNSMLFQDKYFQQKQFEFFNKTREVVGQGLGQQKLGSSELYHKFSLTNVWFVIGWKAMNYTFAKQIGTIKYD